MHGFSLVMTSILAHPWAKQLQVFSQKLVQYFRASTRPMWVLLTIAKAQGINTTLHSSNKTRMTSVYICLQSVHALKDALRSLLRKSSSEINLPRWLLTLIEDQDRTYWEQLGSLCQVLAPFSQVVMAVQGDGTTLADITRYWIYLARELKKLSTDLFVPRGGFLHLLCRCLCYNKTSNVLYSFF
jgi:hypothetical protein